MGTLHYHPMLPETTHDEQSRMDFTSTLIRQLDAVIRPQLRTVYSKTVEPKLRRTMNREPNRHDIAKAMQTVDPNKLWYTLRTDAQDMMYRNAGPMIMRQLPEMIDRAKSWSGKGLGSLSLDPSLEIPRYHTAVDIHRKPGGYHTEMIEDDVLAGAEFDQSITMYSMGTQGPNNDDPGVSLAVWVKKNFPDLKPKRILDMGCTIGHNLLPFKDVFPDAEVHGIDVAAPCLRYGHARANALGVEVHFSQQDAENTSFPDGYFDVVMSRIMLHEMSGKAVPAMLKECHRILKPGGLMFHSDAPMFDEMDAYQASLRHWDTLYNNEPFMATVYELPLEKMYADAGFAKASCFRTYVDSELRRKTNYDAAANRAGGKFFVVGARK